MSNEPIMACHVSLLNGSPMVVVLRQHPMRIGSPPHLLDCDVNHTYRNLRISRQAASPRPYQIQRIDFTGTESQLVDLFATLLLDTNRVSCDMDELVTLAIMLFREFCSKTFLAFHPS